MSTKKAIWTQAFPNQVQHKKTPPAPRWKRKQPIRSRSKQMSKRMAWYSALLKTLYGDRNRGCGVFGCESRMVDNHHTRGRNAEMLNRSEWFMPVCRAHHDLAKSQPDEARKMQGYNPFGAVIPLLCPAGKWNEPL